MIVWYYRNSVLASIVSILGSVAVVGGVAMMPGGDTGMIIAGVFLIAAGIAMMIGGKFISRNKSYKKWWEEILTKVPPAHIAGNVNLAIQVYNANPKNWTLKKIEELNPTAAQLIRYQKAKK